MGSNTQIKTSKILLNFFLVSLALWVIDLIDKFAFGQTKGMAFGQFISPFVTLLSSAIFFVLALRGFAKAKAEMQTFFKQVRADIKGFFMAILLLAMILGAIFLVLGYEAIDIRPDSSLFVLLYKVFAYGLIHTFCVLAFFKHSKEIFTSVIANVFLYTGIFLTADYFIFNGSPAHLIMHFFYCTIFGFAVLSDKKGFAFGFVMFYYIAISCNLICNCNKYNFAGLTFVTSETAPRSLLVLGVSLFYVMVGLLMYFYRRASLFRTAQTSDLRYTGYLLKKTPQNELVLANSLALVRKNRKAIVPYRNKMAKTNDEHIRLTLPVNWSYYEVYDSNWNRLISGFSDLTKHSETRYAPKFFVGERWQVGDYYVKVITGNHLYVGILAVVANMKDFYELRNSYDFNNPPNKYAKTWHNFSDKTKHSLALLYNKNGDEVHMYYDTLPQLPYGRNNSPRV
jgi:hypothetical protein